MATENPVRATVPVGIEHLPDRVDLSPQKVRMGGRRKIIGHTQVVPPTEETPHTQIVGTMQSPAGGTEEIKISRPAWVAPIFPKVRAEVAAAMKTVVKDWEKGEKKKAKLDKDKPPVKTKYLRRRIGSLGLEHKFVVNEGQSTDTQRFVIFDLKDHKLGKAEEHVVMNTSGVVNSDRKKQLRANKREAVHDARNNYKTQQAEQRAKEKAARKRNEQTTIEEVNRKIKEQFEIELKRSKEDAEEKDKRIKDLIEQITELTKELRASKKAQEEVALEMEKKLAVEEEKIRLAAQKKAEEEQHLKIAAKDKQLQDTLKELEDAKRKLQQGSQQTQGEVFELEFEELLQKEFPHDKIKPVGKGVRGGDIIQEVWDARGNYNGKILWELKNTKTWTEGWVDKLKTDKRSINAEEAVLISEILPATIQTAGYREGIWVTKREFVIGLASALRASLIQLYYAKAASKGKDEKVEILYEYLSGVEFKHRIEGIIEAFTNMQTDIEKEKRYFATKWARDEKNIRQVIDNTFGMHGDFKGIIGNNLPTIKGLELPELGAGDE